jgi:hypothetical protein
MRVMRKEENKMRTRVFAEGVLIHDGKILILKRGKDAPTHPGELKKYSHVPDVIEAAKVLGLI